MTFNGTTKVYSGILREVRVDANYPDVRVYGDAPIPFPPTDVSMQLELMNVKEEYEFDAPDEQ